MGAADIKALRERTGAGMLDCKKALDESGGDVEKAIDWLRSKGIASRCEEGGACGHRRPRGTRTSTPAGRSACSSRVNCETDFVAMNDEFKALCNDIAMHIAAAAPEFVAREEVSPTTRSSVSERSRSSA